jgi:signal transduction histidine kinase
VLVESDVVDLVGLIIERAATTDAATRRLAHLLTATRRIAADIDVSQSLTELVELARELVGARSASVCVFGPDGTVEDLVEVGDAPDRDQDQDDGPEHPSGILAAVHVGGDVVGELRLDGGEFERDDERVGEAIANVVGVVVTNARVYAEARLAQRWISASEEINEHLLDGDLGTGDLPRIARLVVELADAAFVGLVAAGSTRFEVQSGSLSYNATLDRDPAFLTLPASVAAAIGDEQAVRRLEGSTPGTISGFGPTMVVDWGEPGADTLGAIVVARGTGAHQFTGAERQMAVRFVRSVSIARALAHTRTDRELLALSEERERIARDLHDHVIQSLFAVGLGLQSVVGQTSGQPAARISAQIDAIDVTIRQIRQTIFELSSPASASGYSQKQRLNQLVRTILEGEGIDSSLDFRGPVDALIDSDVGEDVEAVLREALSNVVRHARASRVDISVAVSTGDVRVLVTDNGRGLGRVSRRSGLRNLQERAAARGGSFAIAGRAPSGTTLDWAVPRS